MKTSGIYKIINKTNGKYYVGSSENIHKKRWVEHKYKLRNNVHCNPKLQRAWNKYGETSFVFCVVEVLPPSELLTTEQQYLDECRMNPGSNYNLSYDATAPMRGRTHSSKTKLQMSKNHHFTIEDRRKMSERRKGKKHSQKTKEKISKSLTGKNHINYDHTTYRFVNTQTNEKFCGTRYEFRVRYDLNKCSVNALVTKRLHTLMNWVISSQCSVS